MMSLLEVHLCGIGWLIEALGLFLGAVVLFYWRRRSKRDMLNQIPGPAGWPIIGCILDLYIPKEKILPNVLEWVQRYGPVLYCNAIGVSSVILSGPEGIQTLLSSRHNLTKGYFYDFIKPWLGSSLLTSSGSKWRSKRRILDPAFHYKILENFIDVFNTNSAILVSELGKHLTKDYVEIDEYISLCTLDNVCETVMGTSMNAQKGEALDYILAEKRMCNLFVERNLYPWLHLDFIFHRTSSGREHKKLLETLHGFCSKVIDTKMLEYQEKKSRQRQTNIDSDERKRLSVLDILLEFSDQSGNLTTEDIRDEVSTFMFAGHDTTAAALSWAIFLLGCHEDVQDQVVKEQAEIFGNDQRMPTLADFNRMTYLDKVIKEVLRMYPSVPSYSRVLEEPLKIGQYVLPAGTSAIVCAFFLHHNPDIYPDPEKFDPERFSPEQSAERHPYAYVPFSAGFRNCIGQKFARLEIMSVLTSVLREFRLKTLQKEEMVVIPDIVLKSKQPFKTQISPRVQ